LIVEPVRDVYNVGGGLAHLCRDHICRDHTNNGCPSFPSFGKLGTTSVCATDFLFPNRGVEAAGNMPRGIVRSAQLSKRTKAGAAECRARVEEIKAGPAPPKRLTTSVG
jgi:hypothetical protein